MTFLTEPEDLDPGQTANKGPKACTTCAKAKSRCIPGPPHSDKCERCHRLQKPCASQTPAPPRAKKEPRPTRVAELEKRLNELTSQLHAAKTSQLHVAKTSPAAATTTMTTTTTTTAVVPSSSHPSPSVARPAAKPVGVPFGHLFPGAGAALDPDPAPAATVASPTSPESLPSTSTRATPMPSDAAAAAAASASSAARAREITWPTGAQADADLRLYRGIMQDLFPFVLPPPDMAAATLASPRPFLFKGVVVVASHYDAYRQLVLGDRMLAEVAQAALTKPHKSLDLLQGLQLLVACYNMNSYQLTNLLYLARSMSVTLGARDAQVGLTPAEAAARSLEYMRAFLGCYYLNALVFTTNKRPDAFMNTTHLDGCCKAVEDKAEHASDVLVVKLFRIQQLAQTISLALCADSAAFQSMQVPLTMVVQSFQQQLDLFKSTLPAAVQTNSTLLSHIAIAEILLYEIGLPERQKAGALIPHTDRLGLLWNCLTAAKTFMDIRFAESNLRPRFIYLNASDWLFAVLVALKLRTLELPGWDIRVVDAHLPLEHMVDTQIRDMDELVAKRAEGTQPGDALACSSSQSQGFLDPYERNRQVISHLKHLAARELNALSEAAGRTPECGLTVVAAVAANAASSRAAPSAVAPGLSGGGALAGPAMATDTMMRDLDAAFWSDAFSDPSWLFGDTGNSAVADMDWNY
ncbi:hypothetical protein VD0004_g1580 [Verticillium dahliae]|nr:hypothetical protein VD0004_g1580 [Verticillium dahliae]